MLRVSDTVSMSYAGRMNRRASTFLAVTLSSVTVPITFPLSQPYLEEFSYNESSAPLPQTCSRVSVHTRAHRHTHILQDHLAILKSGQLVALETRPSVPRGQSSSSLSRGVCLMLRPPEPRPGYKEEEDLSTPGRNPGAGCCLLSIPPVPSGPSRMGRREERKREGYSQHGNMDGGFPRGRGASLRLKFLLPM